MQDWSNVKHILCIRPDNMGDLVMSGPALRALKFGLNACITVLTSSVASAVAQYMPEVDEVIAFDVPWVKTKNTTGPNDFSELVEKLKKRSFDAAVIFTVYSQNPLPSAMIAYQAGIPKILAYCRENPYGLITNWVVDKEPFAYIRHQVARDLRLVNEVCPNIGNKSLKLTVNEADWTIVENRLTDLGLDLDQPWLILHAGVSEEKRQLPQAIWIEAGRELINRGYRILLTGATSEKALTLSLQDRIGPSCFDAAGLFSIGQLITLISRTSLLLSVNTGTVHLAAAVGTPVVVLYAQTNPQHTPWMVPNVVIEFPVPPNLKSRNQIIRYVDETVYEQPAPMPDARLIVDAVLSLKRRPAEADQPSREIQGENQAS